MSCWLYVLDKAPRASVISLTRYVTHTLALCVLVRQQQTQLRAAWILVWCLSSPLVLSCRRPLISAPAPTYGVLVTLGQVPPWMVLQLDMERQEDMESTQYGVVLFLCIR